MSLSSVPIAVIAANEYRQRQRAAVEAVRNRVMPAEQAQRHLRPWLAIACVCGADFDELVEPIGDLRSKDTLGQWNISETEARWLVAEDICQRRQWAPLLEKTRNVAFDRFLADACEPNRASAVALQRLALHLAYDINGCHIAPYPGPAAPVAQDIAA